MNASDINIHKILELLPHRYPILLVDRVLEFEPQTRIKTLKNVTIDEPYFVGHFPGQPVMPGVMIIEALAQSAGLLTLGADMERRAGALYYLVGIDGARFKRVVRPGDQLHLNVSVVRCIRGIWKFQANATVGGEVACEAELMCTVKQAEG
ncbi:3-hydroxyacyl-[acyl-carrier-protein] dehydratase FabZ [Burkholderia stagnalis]|uniref:3-hydroxyacyl-[acyl-carrier-protein] dehydratase FabZ n=1 Tax=Burkholderia stagnalis TaxID=1503054 RepID=A0A106A4E1_9BURK|nr:3-hydroxyacyl-ACP dehydratase FabZ [Burkholderia stagnalis]AOK54885.1 beta-hydroxyacyl-ACP dehydratase [Burkholderia stagnalis]KAB0637277.1 3-hydroxyacyl-ACP dehydratase FabZ [Burkholderia stagnalis]KVL92143.1 beta-hydroxyacyl-ACP dehydratase [Burkholderia stagnalis]KVM03359.1 beta-hydroxyacyl-ACP dehydratase [Burkholderia stagnalis]KVM74990.1 beta-hydroxyacyl-ACP dehydratase [Burkholderia stagnalis]